MGAHCVKHACNLLQVIGLSSGENEYYAISAGACTGLGIKGILEDWNIASTVRIVSDSSAASDVYKRQSLHYDRASGLQRLAEAKPLAPRAQPPPS